METRNPSPEKSNRESTPNHAHRPGNRIISAPVRIHHRKGRQMPDLAQPMPFRISAKSATGSWSCSGATPKPGAPKNKISVKQSKEYARFVRKAAGPTKSP